MQGLLAQLLLNPVKPNLIRQIRGLILIVTENQQLGQF